MAEKPTVMIVDDEKDFADNLATIVSSDGNYNVVVAYSANDGIEQLRKNQPVIGKNKIGLILLDIKMPEMDGLQFLEKIRLEYSGIGVAILTAFEDKEKWERARGGLVAAYLKKPVQEVELMAKIKRFFDGKESWMIEQTKWELLEKEEKEGA